MKRILVLDLTGNEIYWGNHKYVDVVRTYDVKNYIQRMMRRSPLTIRLALNNEWVTNIEKYDTIIITD